MGVLDAIVKWADGLNEALGRVVMWLTLGCVLVCAAVVILRYAFDTGYIWLQELYVWQHALVFLLGAGFTFRHGGHVRVDILYGKMHPRRQAMIDIAGTVLFLFPWLIVLAISAAPFITSAWMIKEASPQPGGLPGNYLLKATIWVFCGIMALQGLALIARRWLYLLGREDHAPVAEGH